MQSNIALTVPGYIAIFPRKSKTKNLKGKISLNGTRGTMLFSEIRVELKLTRSKMA